jgi:ferric-dicitrate binding protein FerR (iron transport regulator)
LQGEGFFDVPPKTTRTDGPALTVETSDVDVRVLGTRFNVRAYGGDEPLAVAVQKGSVDVQLRESKRSMLHASRRRVHLKEGEGARYKPGNDLEPFMLSSEDVYFGWTDRRLVLREASVAEVVRRLERWYGEDVELRNGEDANATLSATFHGESLTEALQVVNSVLGTDIVLAPSQRDVPPVE